MANRTEFGKWFNYQYSQIFATNDSANVNDVKGPLSHILFCAMINYAILGRRTVIQEELVFPIFAPTDPSFTYITAKRRGRENLSSRILEFSDAYIGADYASLQQDGVMEYLVKSGANQITRARIAQRSVRGPIVWNQRTAGGDVDPNLEVDAGDGFDEPFGFLVSPSFQTATSKSSTLEVNEEPYDWIIDENAKGANPDAVISSVFSSETAKLLFNYILRSGTVSFPLLRYMVSQVRIGTDNETVQSAQNIPDAPLNALLLRCLSFLPEDVVEELVENGTLDRRAISRATASLSSSLTRSSSSRRASSSSSSNRSTQRTNYDSGLAAPPTSLTQSSRTPLPSLSRTRADLGVPATRQRTDTGLSQSSGVDTSLVKTQVVPSFYESEVAVPSTAAQASSSIPALEEDIQRSRRSEADALRQLQEYKTRTSDVAQTLYQKGFISKPTVSNVTELLTAVQSSASINQRLAAKDEEIRTIQSIRDSTRDRAAGVQTELRLQLDASQRRLAQLEKALEVNNEEIQRLKSFEKPISESYERLMEERQSLTDRLTQANLDKNKIETAYKQFRTDSDRQIKDLQAQHEKLVTETEALRRDFTASQQEVTRLRNELRSKNDDYNSLQLKYNNLVKLQTELRVQQSAKASSSQSELDALKARFDRQSAEYNRALTEVETLRTRIATLTQQETLRALEQHSRAAPSNAKPTTVNHLLERAVETAVQSSANVTAIANRREQEKDRLNARLKTMFSDAPVDTAALFIAALQQPSLYLRK